MPELLTAILTVQLGQEDWDSREVKLARSNSSCNGLLLALKNGQSVEIPTPNLQGDLETLRSCGVAIG